MVEVETYAALRTLVVADRAAVLVKGRTTAHDGAGGIFYWFAASTLTDDGGTIIQPTRIIGAAPGRYLRQGHDGTTFIGQVNPRWYGATESTTPTLNAFFTAAEACSAASIDMNGCTVLTTRNVNTLTKQYHNGDVLGVNTSGRPQLAQRRAPLNDVELTRPRTKSPIIDWSGKRVLWLGTSIPAYGRGLDSYPEMCAMALGFTVDNMAWPGSGAVFDPSEDPYATGVVKALSMTEDDRLAGLALYGPTSAYSDTFVGDGTIASQQTCDYRIMQRFGAGQVHAVVLDHIYNDRGRPLGNLNPTPIALTGITFGVTTTFTLADTTGIAAGDALVFTVGGSIVRLNHLAARVQSVSGLNVVVNVNSSSYTGTFSVGSVVKVDRTTIAGAFHFLIATIRNASLRAGYTTLPTIILAGSPSEYLGGSYSSTVYGGSRNVKAVADKWGLAFFDVAYAYDVKQQDLPVYFTDSTHPATAIARKPLAAEWIKWLSGGYGAGLMLPNTELRFELTSNTTLVVRARGSDGVVRSTTLTLS